MGLSFESESIPLEVDADNVIRVGKTRVTLDTVIGAFASGATAEEIVQRYPSLSLADVYQVIAYYLRQPSAVEAYLQQRKLEGGKVKKRNEDRFDPEGIRARLLARRAGQKPK